MAKNTEETTEKKKRGRPKKNDSVVQDNNEEKKAAKRGGKGVNGNLVSFDQLTESERRALSTKAGVASGAARRRKKELREFTRDFLMQDAAPVLKGNMSMLGVDAEEMSNLAAMVVRMFSKAVNQGDLNAARTIIEWAGLAPLQQERENEAVARMKQVLELTGGNDKDDDEGEDVVFYIPQNNRAIITSDDLVTVSDE